MKAATERGSPDPCSLCPLSTTEFVELKREVMSVLGKVRRNENCSSQTSLWCEWIVISFII